MDGQQFDRLVQGVAGGLNRRRAIGGLVVGAVALLTRPVQDEVAAKKRGHQLSTEGPCGNGSIKDNRCKRDSQCCTGFCDTSKGKQPHGRCRCKKAGQRCQEDRNCCATAGQPMTCQDNICVTTVSPVCSSDEAVCPTGLANSANDGCCLKDVVCCNGDSDCSDGQICASGCCQNVCRTTGKNGVVAAC